MLWRDIPLAPAERKPALDGLIGYLGRHREACLFAALVLAALVPVLAVKLPPMPDLMGHMGRYSVQTSLDQHPWLKQYYSIEWRVIGNLGADLLVQMLHPFVGVETAVRLIVILNQALAASAIVLLSREVHGRITASCILALPLIYSLPFNFGFLNFTLSMALALLAFVLWLRLSRLGLIRLRQCLFVPIGLAIWICHTFGWAFLGLLCTAASLVRAYEAGRKWHLILWDTGLNCLPLLAPLIPMLLWRAESVSDGTSGWFEPLTKLLWLMWMMRLDWREFDLLSGLGLLVLSYLGMRGKGTASDKTLAVAAGLCFLAFFLLPKDIFGSYYADMRLAPYAIMLGLLAFDDSTLGNRVRQGMTVVAILFLAARLTATTTVYMERERVLNETLPALDAIPVGARVASIVSLPCPMEWELPWLSHVGGMALARKYAVSNDQWSTPGMNPLTISFPEAGYFAKNPSAITYPSRCEARGEPIVDVIERVPKSAFTHIWIVGLLAPEIPHPKGSTLVWQGRDSAVFRFDTASR